MSVIPFALMVGAGAAAIKFWRIGRERHSLQSQVEGVMLRKARSVVCVFSLIAAADGPASPTPRSAWPTVFARLFSESAAKLNSRTVAAHFQPFILVEDYSRDRCEPIIKARGGSSLPVIASFIGTTFHSPCPSGENVIIMKFQFLDPADTLESDVNAVRQALSATNGPPCSIINSDHTEIYWSNRIRAMLLSSTIDQGVGFTLSYFSRLSVLPFSDGADQDAYDLWNGTLPETCRLTASEALGSL